MHFTFSFLTRAGGGAGANCGEQNAATNECASASLERRQSRKQFSPRRKSRKRQRRRPERTSFRMYDTRKFASECCAAFGGNVCIFKSTYLLSGAALALAAATLVSVCRRAVAAVSLMRSGVGGRCASDVAALRNIATQTHFAVLRAA